MEWTTEKPSKPGWYWHSKCAWAGRENEGPVCVKVEDELLSGELRAYPAFMDYSEKLDDEFTFPGLWYGPIDAPALPANAN